MEPLAAGDPRQVGPYRLRARLGAGGMGQVFLGYSPAGRAVAVKVIHRELARDPAFRTRFRREVAAASVVSGAYTAPVTAAGPDDDPPWLATVLVPGPSLAEAVEAAGPLPTVSVWKLAAGLVEALQAVHSCGLVHRDLKPANVLLALDGPRLIDFGISRAMEKTAMTSTGMIVGTPAFMSPEQAEGIRVGSASDVFSLGCVIVFAATARGPFGGGPQASMLYRVVHAEPALDELPGRLRDLAAACLAKAPADRPGLAALVDTIAAGRVPDEGDALASFWPVAVTGLIRSHQARLATEMRDGPAAPGAAAARPAAPAAAGPAAPAAAHPAAPAAAHPATVLSGTVLSGTVPAGQGAVHPATAAPGAAPGTPAAPGPGGPGAAPAWPAGPARPGDAFIDGMPPPGGETGPGVSRRRVVIGLAVAAGAGLAAAGWELARGGTPPSAASGIGSHPSAKASGQASQPSPATSTGAQRTPTVAWSFRTGGLVYAIAFSRGTVFAGSTDDKVYALRASDGHPLWDFPTRGIVQSKIAAVGGTVYVGSNDTHVYALRASDGHPLWAFPTGGSIASTIAVSGGAVYAGSGDDMLYALRAGDGSRLWSVSLGTVKGIAVAGGAVYACSFDDMVYARRASDGSPLWSFPTGPGGAVGIALADGVVYVGSGDGKVYALRASDGRQLWEFAAGGPVESGVAVAGGLVYIGSNADMVVALRASDGKKMWHSPTQGSVTSDITVADRIVYAGGNDAVMRALNASNGKPVWNFAITGPVESQIVVASGVAYVGSNDSKVYALHG